MKIQALSIALLIFTAHSAMAQKEVTSAAKKSCECLSKLNPEALNKKELNFSILGCLSRNVEGIQKTLEKQKLWTDSSYFKYLGLVSNEARTVCPEVFIRLRKKEVEIDSSKLKINPDAGLAQGFAQAVCNCLAVIKDVKECMKKVGSANKSEFVRRSTDGNVAALLLDFSGDVMVELSDHCDDPAILSDESFRQLKAYPTIKTGCEAVVLGEFSMKTMLGETRFRFTPTTLQEFSEGKLKAEYTLKWTGCSVLMTCTSSNSTSIKVGNEVSLELKRASSKGFFAIANYLGTKPPVIYTKIK